MSEFHECGASRLRRAQLLGPPGLHLAVLTRRVRRQNEVPVAQQINLTTMPVEDSYDGPRMEGAHRALGCVCTLARCASVCIHGGHWRSYAPRCGDAPDASLSADALHLGQGVLVVNPCALSAFLVGGLCPIPGLSRKYSSLI